MIRRNNLALKVMLHQRAFRSANIYLQNNEILTAESRIVSLLAF